MSTEENKKKEDLLLRRYGADAVPENIKWNKQLELLFSHKSVRRYLPDDLEEGTIETIVAAAQSASNSSNLNQWSVIAVINSELKAQVAEVSREGSKFGMGNPYIEQAPVLLLWVADMSRNYEIATGVNGSAEVQKYTDALIMATVDTSIAAQNAVVAAESLGLGVVYLGVMRNNAKKIDELFKLPQYSYVVFGMCVGKPDPACESSIRPRLSQKTVLHYNRYNKDIWSKEVEKYEVAFRKFREDSGMKMKTWSDGICFSVNDMTYMDGREDLRTTLEEKGFLFL